MKFSTRIQKKNKPSNSKRKTSFKIRIKFKQSSISLAYKQVHIWKINGNIGSELSDVNNVANKSSEFYFKKTQFCFQ